MLPSFPISQDQAAFVAALTTPQTLPYLQESHWLTLLTASFTKEGFSQEISKLEEKPSLIQFPSGKTLIDLAFETGRLDALEIILSGDASMEEPAPKKRKIENASSLSTSPETFIRYINAILKGKIGGRFLSYDQISSYLQLFHSSFGDQFLLSLPSEQLFEHHNTLLHVALLLPNVRIFNTLLHCKKNNLYENAFGCTPLLLAVLIGNVQIVKLLMEESATKELINKQTQKKDGQRTALHVAAREGHLEIVKILVENGADISIKDADECSVLHYAAGTNSVDVIEYLLRLSGIAELINAPSSEKDYQRTALHVAVGKNHLEIVKILVKNGADISIKDADEWSVLHCAAGTNSVDVIEYLVTLSGIAELINAPSSEGQDQRTALHVAAQEGHLEIVKILVAHGADITIQSAKGGNPLNYAAINNHSTIAEFLLKQPRIRDILNAKRLDDCITEAYLEETALFQAAKQKDLVIFHLLVEAGALLDQKNKQKNLTLLNNIILNGLEILQKSSPEKVTKEKETLIKSIFSLAKLTELKDLAPFSFIVKYGSNQDISDALNQFKLPESLLAPKKTSLRRNTHLHFKHKIQINVTS